MTGANRRAFRGPGGELPVREDDALALDLLLLVEGETSGREREAVIAEFGRSRSTYFEKLRRFREGGTAALVAKPSGPRGPWRRTYEIVRQIVRARVQERSRSAPAIAEELQRLGFRVSVRSVERTLSEFGLTGAQDVGARLAR